MDQPIPKPIQALWQLLSPRHLTKGCRARVERRSHPRAPYEVWFLNVSEGNSFISIEWHANVGFSYHWAGAVHCHETPEPVAQHVANYFKILEQKR